MLEQKVAIWWEELTPEEQHLLITLLHDINLEEFGIKISAKGKYFKDIEEVEPEIDINKGFTLPLDMD